MLKLTKYLKIKSVRINIYNTNDYCFPIVYTYINHNPPMNPLKFCQDQIKNGWLIAIIVCANWQNIWKFCPFGWISTTPINLCFRYFTHAFTTILPWILCIYYNPPLKPVKCCQDLKSQMADLSPFLFAQIYKIF